MSQLLSKKKYLVIGVANERSIAWGITQELKKHGAKVALTYLGDALKKRVEPLAAEVSADFICELDVTQDDHYKNLYETVQKEWGSLDGIIHSVAFADREDLKGRFVETSRKGFALACDISAFSLVGLCQTLEPLLNENSSVIAMTYYGAVKVVSNYNVMGVAKAALEASVRYLANDLGEKKIRVNAISAGPIKTLAASGISGFRGMLAEVEQKAPLRSNVSQQDVGKSAVYLLSDLSTGVTGQTLYVDSGLSILGN